MRPVRPQAERDKRGEFHLCHINSLKAGDRLAIMTKIELFERYVLEYENWFKKKHFVYDSELHMVKTLLPKNGKGIEIGVGTGRFAAPSGIKAGA